MLEPLFTVSLKNMRCYWWACGQVRQAAVLSQYFLNCATILAVALQGFGVELSTSNFRMPTHRQGFVITPAQSPVP